MASYTPNLNLILPVGTEKVSRQIINSNNGIIDSAVGNIVAPSVQGVSTLAELKTYLLAVAGNTEARKNVPVQFNLAAAASPFNSGLYTGIMQKETNGAFSVLCHGYNGGVVEVQYASSTWTIMNLTSEIASLNSKITKVSIATELDSSGSLSDLKSKLVAFANTFTANEVRPIKINIAFSDDNFNQSKSYEGHLYVTAVTTSYLYFYCTVGDDSGNTVWISYSDGTWSFNSIKAFNSKMQSGMDGVTTTTDSGASGNYKFYGTRRITFQNSFNTVPKVVVTVYENAAWWTASAANVDSSGFDIVLCGNTNETTKNVMWIATE